ncbi:MAG TPA: hypothetical protein VNM89_01280 [Solirubrobacterales bacterium]|nr:hypothetical protein [Solirubrobacterales bacterium]
MATLLVGYDLNKPGQDYSGLIKRLKNVGTTWWHRLDSTWLVKTTMSPSELRDDLKNYIDSGDELLVIDVTGAGWAGTGFSNYRWLHDNL